MSSKNSRPPGNNTTRKTDDFRAIRGLPKTAKAKLHSAGILTYAQLAAMSPHEIVAAIGTMEDVSAERILREDWLGQASKLAASAAKVTEPIAEPSAVPTPKSASDGQRTSFALELKLNADHTVKQTRVMHVESEEKDAEEKWAGWDSERLINFFVQRAKMILPGSEAARRATAEAPSDRMTIEERLKKLHANSDAALAIRTFPTTEDLLDTTPAKANASFASKKLEVYAGGSDLPSDLAPSGEAYSVRIVFDPREMKSSSSSGLEYTVRVYAKNLAPATESGQHLVIGESHGVVSPSDDLIFAVKGTRLPKGMYRLQATASFNALGDVPPTLHPYTTCVEGGVLQVY